MRLFYFILLFVVILTCYRLHKDVLHPIILSCSFWFLFPLCYELLCLSNSRYWVLTDKFYYIISLYLIPFIFFTVFFIGDFTGRRRYTNIGNKVSTEKKVYIHNLINLCLIGNFLLIIRIFLLCHTFNIISAISVFRVITTEKRYLITPDITLLLYIFSITPPLCCYIFLNKIKINRIKLIFFIIEFLIITVLYVSKGRIMKYFIMIFAILLLNRKLSLKIFLFGSIGIFGLVFSMTMIRDKNFMENFSFLDYMFVYFLSPLPAFDMLINDIVPYDIGPFGGRTLGFFYRVFVRLFGGTAPSYSKMFIGIPAKVGQVPTNVFTCFGSSYMDYGVFGLFIFGFFTALVFGSAYKKSFYLGKSEFIIFYILIIYCLIFQFFGDFFFQFLSVPLQDLLCSYLVVRTIRTRIIK